MPDLSQKMVSPKDCDEHGYCLHCGSATVHKTDCACVDPVSSALADHKFSTEGSIFAPETLQDVKCRLSFIAASECNCNDSPHENAIHDLAHDDVPVLLALIEQQAAEIQRLRTREAAVRGIGDRLCGLEGQRAAQWNAVLGREILSAIEGGN